MPKFLRLTSDLGQPFIQVLLPGVTNLAITPATKPIRMVQKRLSMSFSSLSSLTSAVDTI